jgi:hypothetical protein
MVIHTIKTSRNKPEHRVESLTRSLFEDMLHFCRAPFLECPASTLAEKALQSSLLERENLKC